MSKFQPGDRVTASNPNTIYEVVAGPDPSNGYVLRSIPAGYLYIEFGNNMTLHEVDQ